jgi:hypothetical protein
LKGATGAQGVGYDFYVDALGADTLLTYNSFTYLKFGDNERDTSSLVSESGSASSTYTVAAGKAGRYRIEFNLALKNVISSAGSSYDVESYVYVNGSERATASMSASPFSASYPATKYRNLYCTCVLYLQEGATIQFAAKRTSSDSKITIYANKLDKTTESGEDTSVTITKL